jgi:hypothetical protein
MQRIFDWVDGMPAFSRPALFGALDVELVFLTRFVQTYEAVIETQSMESSPDPCFPRQFGFGQVSRQ